LGGGCQVPIGAHATAEDGRVHLIAVVASPDGAELIRGEADGSVSEAEAVGRKLGADLLARGAKEILDAV
jgi:hydroxymethylbilane synthase